MLSQDEILLRSVQALSYFIGVDVGTGSARAGVFDRNGTCLGVAAHEIQLWRSPDNFLEQSSDNIWQACCYAVRRAIAQANISPVQVKGIGFDGTCSFVALDESDRPVSLSQSGNPEQNVILWMDHRAVAQAEQINQTQHKVLRYVGGRISPEMQSPRLLWIKENLPQTWAKTVRFFDLSDFLTYRATGNDTRSLCTTVGKWTYLGHQSSRDVGAAVLSDVNSNKVGWDDSYWQQIGLEDVVQDGYRRIGTHVCPMGTPLAHGLREEAAKELGLVPGTAVGVSLIDAHAGSLGMIGATEDGSVLPSEAWEERLALICGTSSCHHVMSSSPRFIPGVWGPYFSALLPGFWLNEGGQSATGALIDYVIESHPQAKSLKQDADQQGKSVYDLLNERLARLAAQVDFPAKLTQELHLYPDFHGNRSPYADPTLRGMISGLTLSQNLDSLALLYLATIQAIAYQTRQIISDMNAQGYRLNTIFACGGNSKNPVFLQEHADITGCCIVLPQEPEAVLLGSAILGAVAAGEFESLQTAMAAMTHVGQAIEPATGQIAQYHAAKYAVFQKLYHDQITYRDLMLVK